LTYRAGHFEVWEPGEAKGILIPDDMWFMLHQDLLVGLANSSQYGRELLGISTDFRVGRRIGMSEPVLNITKQGVTFGDPRGGQRKSTFHPGCGVGNLVRQRWDEVAVALHRLYDPEDVGQLIQLRTPHGVLYAATVSTFRPDAHPESTTVDGRVTDDNPGNGTGTLSWAELIDSTGSYANDNEDGAITYIQAGPGSPARWDALARFIHLYDTSAIDNDDVISAADSEFTAYDTNTEDLVSSLVITACNPASNTALVEGDFDAVTDTDLSDEITAANWPAAGSDTNFTLNATGLGVIDKTGVTKLAMRWTHDVDRSAPGHVAAQQVTVNPRTSDHATAADRPELSVTHAAPVSPSQKAAWFS
jgi:hypothetical protein